MISGVSLLAIALPAAAQDGEDTITVTATGTRGNVDATGQAVTVIVAEEIDAMQGADLTRVLERAPGVSATRTGGVGAQTAVRIRGAVGEQTLAILDGVRVADPAAPSGGFDFGNLLSTDLSKIEILRGSNSTIWGSDAIGGVIVATSRFADGLSASAEYGARDTVNARLAASLADADTGFLGLSGTWFNTDGFSSAASGSEADGFEQWAINGAARYYIDGRSEVFVRSRYAEGDLDIDGFPAPSFTLADTLDTQETRQWTGSAGGTYDSGPLFLSAAYSFADTERDNLDGSGVTTFASEGRSDRIALRGEWRPFGPTLVHFGGEHEWTSYETLFDAGESTRIAGAYLQGGVEWRGIAAHIGGRVDDHADFGTEVSFGADASYDLTADLRLRASIGEGFKAPSLFQLHSDFGNLLLEPEQSTSFDLGLSYGERAMRDSGVYAEATVYRRDTDNLIDFVSCFGVSGGICTDRPDGTYDNVSRARAQGVEAEIWGSPGEGVTLGAVYTFTDAESRDTGLQLARRPKHSALFTAEFAALERGSLGIDVRVVGASFDDALNTVRLDPYEIVTLRGALTVTDTVEVFGRVENLFDADYQTVAGYGTAGVSAHIGARLAL
ncbi:TonB-dependent receptor [Aurantiacibacter gangjinensis]|uniref:TonB-dependent receptor n=1 Tax=Aurantiacibacter gangjinensis TaxID=502682 RepID=A0A0G9MS40_9SPHN|nr:TonB-dependent receptor [Aurantiacibacter gangjinensis]